MTEWIIHLPIANRRNEKLFDHRWHDMTLEIMENLFETHSEEYKLLTRTNDEPERMMTEWQRMFPPGMVLPQGCPTRAGGEGSCSCGAHLTAH